MDIIQHNTGMLFTVDMAYIIAQKGVFFSSHCKLSHADLHLEIFVAQTCLATKICDFTSGLSSQGQTKE